MIAAVPIGKGLLTQAPQPPAVVSTAFAVLVHFEQARSPYPSCGGTEGGYAPEPAPPAPRELTATESDLYESCLACLTNYVRNPELYERPVVQAAPVQQPRPPVRQPQPQAAYASAPLGARPVQQPRPPAPEEYDPELHGPETVPAGFRTVVGPDGQPRLVPLPGTQPPPPPQQAGPSAGPVQPDELPDMGQVPMEPRNANGKPPAMWPPAPPPGFRPRPPRQF